MVEKIRSNYYCRPRHRYEKSEEEKCEDDIVASGLETPSTSIRTIEDDLQIDAIAMVDIGVYIVLLLTTNSFYALLLLFLIQPYNATANPCFIVEAIEI